MKSADSEFSRTNNNLRYSNTDFITKIRNLHELFDAMRHCDSFFEISLPSTVFGFCRSYFFDKKNEGYLKVKGVPVSLFQLNQNRQPSYSDVTSDAVASSTKEV